MADPLYEKYEGEYKILVEKYKNEFHDILNRITLKLQMMLADPEKKHNYAEQIKGLAAILEQKAAQAKLEADQKALRFIIEVIGRIVALTLAAA